MSVNTLFDIIRSLSDISDIIFHASRISKLLNNKYLIISSNKNHYNIKIVNKYERVLNFNEEPRIIKSNNKDTGAVFIISNTLLISINNIDNIDALEYKTLIIDDTNRSELLKISILYELFQATKLIMNATNIKNKFLIDVINYLLIGESPFYEQINNLLGYESIDFYSNKYKTHWSAPKNLLFKLSKNGYHNINKFILYNNPMDKDTFDTIIYNGSRNREYLNLLEIALKTTNYKINYTENHHFLFDAINNDFNEFAKLLILYYNDLNGISNYPTYEFSWQMLPLNCAIENENYEIIDLLLDHKDIDVNITHGLNGSALFSAITAKQKVTIKKLLGRPDINVNVKNYYNADSPLILLIEKGYIDLAKIILNNKSLDINYVNLEGFTILLTAFAKGHYAFVKLILKHKNVDLYKRVHWPDMDIFDMAKELNNTKILKLLNKYDPNIGI